MDTYLSIDADYFKNSRTAARFIRMFLLRDTPVLVALQHDALLHHINHSGCSRLINVDYHDDIYELKAGPSLPPLHCGSWVTHVAWANKGVLEWRHPHRDHGGIHLVEASAVMGTGGVTRRGTPGCAAGKRSRG